MAQTSLEVKLSHISGDSGKAGVPTETLGIAGTRRVVQAFTDTVIFRVSPTVTESRSASYDDKGLPGPAGIVVYRVTDNRKFSISARLISRNLDEAKINLGYSNALRSWMLPQSEGGNASSPPILRLDGYGKQFYNIPCVMSELSVTFPEDVDYINVGEHSVPIIQAFEISLIEAHRGGREGLAGLGGVDSDANADIVKTSSGFDLASFKNGQLQGF